MVAAVTESMWARAPAPSVTLTASARPLSGKAFSRRSFLSQETGGVISAVRTNLPVLRVSSRRATDVMQNHLTLGGKRIGVKRTGEQARNARFRQAAAL